MDGSDSAAKALFAILTKKKKKPDQRAAVAQSKVNMAATWSGLYTFSKGFDSCTTPIQQLYNNHSHEGGPQYVGPTLM
jgi:hypothetical protein